MLGRVSLVFEAILLVGGVYQTQGVYQRGASNTKFTPQEGRLLDGRPVNLRVGVY